MSFITHRILQDMKELYRKPISAKRFKAYLHKLQGPEKEDLILPVSGYNPMAKGHILEKITELEDLNAEEITQQVVKKFNEEKPFKKTIKVVLNVADDLGGAWTHYCTTDFESKFKLKALISRKFCTPYFWTSELYTKKIIQDRTSAYLTRTYHTLHHPRILTLQDHFLQEVAVCRQLAHKATGPPDRYQEIESFFKTHKDSDDYNLILNFFYGDEAMRELCYPTFGIKPPLGFEYAQWQAIT